MAASKKLITSLILFITFTCCSALICHTCSTLNEEDCFPGVFEVCDSFQDVCIKVATRVEKPHNGPENLFSDNEQVTYISRTCGTKETFEHFKQSTKKFCDVTSIGGGGEQTRCMCTGNYCNSARQLTITFPILAVLLGAKLL